MIRNSFIFLDRISHGLEKSIWNQGVKDWNSFIKTDKIKGLSFKRRLNYIRHLKKASKALFNHDSSFFSLPSTETWRLYNHFRDEAIFLDIEADSKDIIIVGLFDGFETRTLIKDISLFHDVLQKELNKYKLIITFNGSSYDLPKLKKYFNIKINVPHIDLKHCCSRLGLINGLKSIEKDLKIKRPEHLIPRSHNPVDLWRSFMASGETKWLETLVKYNEEDIINLKPLMEFCYKGLKAKNTPL